MTPQSGQPYKNLGQKLKILRGKASESLPEVSGALEIDVETLVKIERGIIRPSEETLLLLVTHFGVREDEASRLWALAGYKRSKIVESSNSTDDSTDLKPVVMVMPDPRIVYTDSVQVTVNNFGVVMNFMQTSTSSTQPMAIARIGMSKQHAKSVLALLAKTLSNNSDITIKQFPSSKNPNNHPKKI